MIEYLCIKLLISYIVTCLLMVSCQLHGNDGRPLTSLLTSLPVVMCSISLVPCTIYTKRSGYASHTLHHGPWNTHNFSKDLCSFVSLLMLVYTTIESFDISLFLFQLCTLNLTETTCESKACPCVYDTSTDQVHFLVNESTVNELHNGAIRAEWRNIMGSVPRYSSKNITVTGFYGKLTC